MHNWQFIITDNVQRTEIYDKIKAAENKNMFIVNLKIITTWQLILIKSQTLINQ